MKGNCNCAAPEQAKEALHCAAAAQEKKQNKKVTLPSPASLHCAALQRSTKKKKKKR